MVRVTGLATSWRGAFALVAAVIGAMVLLDAQGSTPLYRQGNAPVDARVADLLMRMTVEEKIAQLQGIWNTKRDIEDAQGRFDPTKARALIGSGIGEVARPSEIGRRDVGRAVRSAREKAPIVRLSSTENLGKTCRTSGTSASPSRTRAGVGMSRRV